MIEANIIQTRFRKQALWTAELPFCTMGTNIVIMPGKNTGSPATSDVAERLRLTRLALDLTQASIARLCGISAQAWNNNERGRDRISLEQALKLCQTTGVSLDWIFRGIMTGLPHDLAVKIQQLQVDNNLRRRKA